MDNRLIFPEPQDWQQKYRAQLADRPGMGKGSIQLLPMAI